MPDLNSTLDTVLGFVTIVLVLSLIIQSLQNIIKRLLRMKSRQAEQSLRMLFGYALNEAPGKFKSWKYASPILRAATKMPEEGKAESVLKAVKEEVLEVGRKSFWGNAILDSLTKEDLTKILNKVLEKPTTDQHVTEEVKKAIEEAKKAIDGKIEEIEKWYDTVMPGLAERHERGMKWVAVLLSTIVVVLFNANAIEIYRYVASDSAVQKQLIAYGQQLEADQKPPAPPAQPESKEDKDKRLDSMAADFRADVDDIRKRTGELGNFGLTPFTWEKCFTDSAAVKRTLLGWLAMTLLLSMGAPFWEDALGSLFGLKNTLAGKSKDVQKEQPQKKQP